MEYIKMSGWEGEEEYVKEIEEVYLLREVGGKLREKGILKVKGIKLFRNGWVTIYV